VVKQMTTLKSLHAQSQRRTGAKTVLKARRAFASLRLCVRLQLSFVVLASAARADGPVSIPWLGENLVPNAGFEEVTDNGRSPNPPWTAPIAPDSGITVSTDSTVYIKGQHSLKVFVPKSDTNVSASSPLIPVEPDATYLFSIAFRQEGFNASGKPSDYAGVSSYAAGQWLDIAQKQVGSFIVQFPYGPSQWDLRDAFKQAPANARWARVGVTVLNNSQKQMGKTIPSTVWVDAVQLRKYVPPATPHWAKGETTRVVEGGMQDTRVLSYFVGSDDSFNMRGGTWSHTVNDPQAERGAALQAPANVGQGYMAHSPYFPALPPGLYRVRARVKMPAAKDSAPVGFLDVDSQRAGLRQLLRFVPSPERSDKYTDCEADFILRDSSWWSLRLVTYGKEPWSVDSLKVFCLHEFEDRQLLSIYPGSEGELPSDLKPAPFKQVQWEHVPMKGLVVAGFGYDRFRIADVFHAMQLDARMKAVWCKNGMGGMSFVGFPEDPRELFQYSILYLCNVNVRCLALKYKNAIHEYVKRGGALIVLGGHQGYERGGWRGSLIEETMPVAATPALHGGLIHLPNGQPLTVNREIPWLGAISTASSPLTYYLHSVTVKPGGQVLAQAGDKPFIVAGEYGEGRVVCILGVPWGEPGEQGTPFWEWDDWVDLFREVCWWAVKNTTDVDGDNAHGG